MADYLALAAHAYAYAEAHYGDKDARFDVIVECMEKSEIAAALEACEADDEEAAIAWAKSTAGLHHEQELNQAWDGPESVKSSSRYDPAHDPAGPPEPSDDEIEQAMREEMRREPYIDSYTGYPVYSVSREEMALLDAQYDASDAPPYGNMF
jgi:hypothetical protein